MTAADEYQRVLLPLLIAEYGEDKEAWTELRSLRRIAQALAADPGVRAAVEREARAEAWDEGYQAAADEVPAICGVPLLLGPSDEDNPYRQEPSDG